MCCLIIAEQVFDINQDMTKTCMVISRLWRELLADKPRVTKYPVDFELAPASVPEDMDTRNLAVAMDTA